MDINGNSSSVIDSVMRTASPQAVASVQTFKQASELQQQNVQKLMESVPETGSSAPAAPEPGARVGQNIDVKA